MVSGCKKGKELEGADEDEVVVVRKFKIFPRVDLFMLGLSSFIARYKYIFWGIINRDVC